MTRPTENTPKYPTLAEVKGAALWAIDRAQSPRLTGGKVSKGEARQEKGART
ncbi:MAG: hypothetical protein WA161_17925 [Pseudomonas sp.]|uniref:hypothetical protein n=1 Tax=Pseudomonas sp. TaxID=306 RepID=UPI003BB5182F